MYTFCIHSKADILQIYWTVDALTSRYLSAVTIISGRKFIAMNAIKSLGKTWTLHDRSAQKQHTFRQTA